VDECLTGNGGCDPLAPCINTIAGRDCGECPAGYTGNGEVGCADIDECSLATHDCFAATGCNNTVGSFDCTCPDFFFGDGRTCAAAPKAFGYAQMITGDGVLYLWNRETRNNVATAIADVNWEAFASGDGGCGINGNGALFCWDYDSPESPIRIGSATNWQKVDGANTSMCAIQSGGNLFCWPNGNGALGSGDAASSLPVAVSPQGNWTEVSAGDYNATCGIRNGQLFCWGRNVRGILGIGGGVDNLDQLDTPQRVGNASDWTSVAVGEAHACGIRAGSLFCWGAAFANAQADDIDAPVRVGNATDWVAVSCGIAHSLGLRGNGQLFFWGQGIFGAFPTDSQTPLQVGADRSWQRPIFADYALSCATSGADAYCFGQDATVDPDAPPTDTPILIRR
jgi:alpha-tubulin suppressor-like RCC1 family protein